MGKNVPPPWDPGFALPANVKAEGLQRRAFVTRWAPRGTYDPSMPQVTGGYAQPKYVMEEGYGQGTMVSWWPASGSYAGPRVPHWENQRPKLVAGGVAPRGGQYLTVKSTGLSGMGDVGSAVGEQAFPEPYHSYGQKAATHVLTQIQKVPPSQRKAQLKRVLDAVDPSLWSRASEITTRLMKKGVAPKQALHGGLARAMSAGFIAELHHAGKAGAPRARSLAGLGCYGCMGVLGALGAVPAGLVSGASIASSIKPTVATTGAVSAPSGTASSDGKLIWVNGTWRVLMPGDKPVGAFDPTITVSYVRDTMRAGLHVGPFQVPWAEQPLITVNGYKEMPAYWMASPSSASADLAQLGPNLMKDWGDPHFRITGYSAGDVMVNPADAAKQWWPSCSAALSSYQAWLAKLGVGSNRYYLNMLPVRAPTKVYQDTYKVTKAVAGGDIVNKFGYPIVPATTFTHPVDGKTWGIYLMLTIPSIGGYNKALVQHINDCSSLQLMYWVAPVASVTNFLQNRLADSSTIAQVTGFISDVANEVVKIVNYIGDVAVAVAEGLGQLACDALSNPNAVKGATLAGGPAAGAGAAVGQQICGGGPAPPPAPASSSWVLPVAIAGGVGLLALLATKKRKVTP